jgi:hypothetical protein
MKKKESQGAEFAIDKKDIVDLVARAWDDSFARILTNKKAVADRGWSPLNYNCLLLHPEICGTRKEALCETNSSRESEGEQEQDLPTTPVVESTMHLPLQPSISPDDLNLSKRRCRITCGLWKSGIATMLGMEITCRRIGGRQNKRHKMLSML